MGKIIDFPVMDMMQNRLTQFGFTISETKFDVTDDHVLMGIALASGGSATIMVEGSEEEKNLIWYLYIKGPEEETSPGWDGSLADIFHGISRYTAQEEHNLALIGPHHMALHMVTLLWNILELIPNKMSPIENAFDGDAHHKET